ncbi:MAG: hypothetical protein L0332_18650 [Chloroflexi bacterium]|nr:hypothetical protein [Chloroflexota bacterium]MCI0579978.1 hypothetical protein [Chloroflexota bacterium]MCI0647490.1 hypothetical protein [Chloroflexota bacterium]MCI0728717.1 hypothetical protein [Chloroflexota bacterium]
MSKHKPRPISTTARLTLALMLLALLLPVYGPWLDSNFAGRQPLHRHIYLGTVNLAHHSAPEPAGHKDHSESDSDVVNLPDQTAANQGGTLWLMLADVTCPVPQAGDHLAFGPLLTCLPCQGRSVLPLEQPPRV